MAWLGIAGRFHQVGIIQVEVPSKPLRLPQGRESERLCSGPVQLRCWRVGAANRVPRWIVRRVYQT